MNDLIRRVLTKARGVLGLGLIGAAVGLLGGAVVGLLSLLIETGFPTGIEHWGVLLRGALVNAATWSGLGAFTGIGFGALMAVTDGKRSLEELSQWKMGLLGAVAGGLFLPLREIYENVLTVAELAQLLPSIGILGAFGAALGSSMVALAKRAHRVEVAAVEEVMVLPAAEK